MLRSLAEAGHLPCLLQVMEMAGSQIVLIWMRPILVGRSRACILERGHLLGIS